MKLPNAAQAFVDIRKLRDYCLSPEHLRGRHKARVFVAVLGLTADDAEELRDSILAAVLECEANLDEEDQYGQRFTVDFAMSRDAGEATIRTSWIVRQDEDYPRLITCYVLE
jgi:hypothetical protein